jgi:hypothetical protein
MALEIRKWDTEGREIGCIERPLLGSSSYSDDAAENGGILDERKKIGDETKAGIVV